MHESHLILDQLAIIKIEATLWSGRKQLRPEDLILGNGSRLPPRDLASLGSKRIADPRDIQVFARLKKEGERCCQKVGTRFIGGYAIPESRLDAVTPKLDLIRQKFEAARFDFLSRYDQAILDWTNLHPDFKDVIWRSVDPVSKVAALLAFDYVVFRLRPAEDRDESLERKLKSIPEILMGEIAVDARTFATESLTGKKAVTRRVVAPLRRIRDKLKGLAFVDASLSGWVDELDELLDRLPLRGEIRGSYLRELEAMALRLSQSDHRPGEKVALESGFQGHLTPALAAEAPDDLWCSNAPGLVRSTSDPEGPSSRGSFWF
ncbi:MAG: hypothetical protein RLZ25_2175 [Pseudomonadota bacterium]|jgi:hypothetical protein